MHRRDVLIGAACVAALAAAEALRPRTAISLRSEGKLADIIPRQFDKWKSTDGGDIVIPRTPDSLASRLYSDMMARIYSQSDDSIMLLIAYGEAQTDMLQLHRPESCYPAVGFAISNRHLVSIPVGDDVAVPGVALTATSGERVEDIVYWTRVGEYLPQTAGDQRRDRLQTSLRGIIPDGVLVRCSVVRTGRQPRFDLLYGFLTELMEKLKPVDRKMLVGNRLAAELGTTART